MRHIVEAAKKRLKELSGISPIVYHLTTVNGLMGILKTNKFALTLEEALDIEDKWGGKPYFFSTMRTKSGKYQQGEVRITLDGRKLSQRYKGKAIDYYGANWRSMDGGAYEQEDRIWNTKPYIPKAKDYIVEIDINIDYVKKQQMYRILAITRRDKIKVNVYKTQSDFRLNKNALQGYAWLGEMMEMDTALERKYNKGSSSDARNISNWYFYIKGLQEFIKSSQNKTIGDYLRSTYGKRVSELHQQYDMDIKSQLSSTISNARTKKDPLVVYYINKIHRLAKNKGYKVHKFHEYILQLRKQLNKLERAQFIISKLKSFEAYYDDLNKAIENSSQLPENKHMQWVFAHDYIFEDLDKNIKEIKSTESVKPEYLRVVDNLLRKVQSGGHTSIEMAIVKMRKEHEYALQGVA